MVTFISCHNFKAHRAHNQVWESCSLCRHPLSVERFVPREVAGSRHPFLSHLGIILYLAFLYCLRGSWLSLCPTGWTQPLPQQPGLSSTSLQRRAGFQECATCLHTFVFWDCSFSCWAVGVCPSTRRSGNHRNGKCFRLDIFSKRHFARMMRWKRAQAPSAYGVLYLERGLKHQHAASNRTVCQR